MGPSAPVFFLHLPSPQCAANALQHRSTHACALAVTVLLHMMAHGAAMQRAPASSLGAAMSLRARQPEKLYVPLAPAPCYAPRRLSEGWVVTHHCVLRRSWRCARQLRFGAQWQESSRQRRDALSDARKDAQRASKGELGWYCGKREKRLGGRQYRGLAFWSDDPHNSAGPEYLQ